MYLWARGFVLRILRGTSSEASECSAEAELSSDRATLALRGLLGAGGGWLSPASSDAALFLVGEEPPSSPSSSCTFSPSWVEGAWVSPDLASGDPRDRRPSLVSFFFSFFFSFFSGTSYGASASMAVSKAVLGPSGNGARHLICSTFLSQLYGLKKRELSALSKRNIRT